MSQFDETIAKLEAKVDEYKAHLDKWKAQAEGQLADGKGELADLKAKLEAKLGDAESELQGLREAGERAGIDLKNKTDNLVNDLKASFDKAKTRFK